MSAHAHFARSLRHDALDRLSDRRLYRELAYVDGQWTAGDSADSFEVTDPASGATVAFVASGRAEAGALNASVWDKLVEAHNPNAAKVRVIGTTPPFFDYNWTVRPGLDPALTQKIKDAFLKLDAAQPQDREVLELQRASRFVPTQPANYDGIEAAARSAGLTCVFPANTSMSQTSVSSGATFQSPTRATCAAGSPVPSAIHDAACVRSSSSQPSLYG